MKIVRVAKVLVIDPDNQILVLRVGEYKEKPYRSHTPDFPGGLVDPGESEHEAVIREAQEEAGILLDPSKVILAYAETELHPEDDESMVKMLYMTKVDSRPEVTISWEHEAFEWCDFDTLLQTHTFRPFFANAIKYIQENSVSV